jgi:SAM-dependent methyltransferase
MSYDAPERYGRLIEPRYGQIADALVAAARLREGDVVLELGAGTGLVTRKVAPVVQSLVATDLSREMLGRARRTTRSADNVTFAVLDWGAPFPFLDCSFSLVLGGLTYVQDSRPALREVARVLRPGGRLALSMWGPAYHEKRIMNAALGSLGAGRFPTAAPGRAVQRLERLGFRWVRRTDIEIVNRFGCVADYLEYRRGFGKPLGWTASFHERFLRALEREALRTATADGAFELGWTQTVITARPPRRIG